MINLSANAEVVMNKRIARTKEDGTVETPEDVFERVASFIARADEEPDRIERTKTKFLRLLSSLDFIPNSPCLTGAGTDIGNLSACFVLPVEDSMEGIFDAVRKAALIHKTGGGTGFSFSKLRPEGYKVSRTHGISSGPVSFMQVFDAATAAIKQGGTRRGANMGIIRVDHPDIFKFINIKNDGKTLQNFNISVAITDEFMEALKSDREFLLRHTGNNSEKISVPSKEIWKAIIRSAHATGDPGLVFIDRANMGKANPVPSLGPIEATNPCGEQFLYSYDSCNLGSINLSNFVNGDEGKKDFDWPRLGEVVHDCVHFLDNVIEMNRYPIPEVEKVTKAVRRIGLGVMGWADSLFKLEIPYDSRDAIALAEKVMRFIDEEAFKASKGLAVTRGPFPTVAHSIYADNPVRNAARTTVAPTGTISIIAGCSSGIEPAFALAFRRSHYLDDDPNKRKELLEVNPILLHWLMENIKKSHEIQKILDELLDGKRSDKIPSYFVTSHDISPEWHVRMQAAFQKHVDNSVSKTINLPHEATVDDVEKAYLLAWETDCKGITIYRDGSKDMQVLSVAGNTKKEVANDKRELKRTRSGIHHKFSVGEFDGYIGVGLYDDGLPGEVFIIGNKTGTTSRGFLDSIGKLISKALQRGEPVGEIATSLIGQKFEPAGFTGNSEIPTATSIVDYVGRWLDKTFNQTVGDRSKDETKRYVSGDLCPECDAIIYYVEGCGVCYNCGYSRC
jgi:ribonucleoside-diphosphate reductase alpha chain